MNSNTNLNLNLIEYECEFYDYLAVMVAYFTTTKTTLLVTCIFYILDKLKPCISLYVYFYVEDPSDAR